MKWGMWARWCELVLAAWLVASAWLLAGDGAASIHAAACGGIALALSSASFHRSRLRTHLALLPVACWLCGYGWLAARHSTSASAAAQNAILVGLLLAIFAVVPNDAADPPQAWRGRSHRR